MVLLSPPKLLMVLVIALIVLGPDKLPSMARRVGAAWSEFTRWRAHLEGEVRATFPDLPSTTEITRAVRSPLSLLDRLAEEHDATARDGPGLDGAAPAMSSPPEPATSRRAPPPMEHPDARPPGPSGSSSGLDVSSLN